MQLTKKARIFSALAFVFPSIPVALCIVWLIFVLLVGSFDGGWAVFFASIFLMLCLTVTAPLGGLCGLIFSLLARKHGAKKRQVAATVYSVVVLVAGVPFILLFL